MRSGRDPVHAAQKQPLVLPYSLNLPFFGFTSPPSSSFTPALPNCKLNLVNTERLILVSVY